MEMYDNYLGREFTHPQINDNKPFLIVQSSKFDPYALIDADDWHLLAEVQDIADGSMAFTLLYQNETMVLSLSMLKPFHPDSQNSYIDVALKHVGGFFDGLPFTVKPVEGTNDDYVIVSQDRIAANVSYIDRYKVSFRYIQSGLPGVIHFSDCNLVTDESENTIKW